MLFRSRLDRALAELRVSGVKTTTPLHRALAHDPEVRAAQVHTKFLEHWLEHQPPDLTTYEEADRL